MEKKDMFLLAAIAALIFGARIYIQGQFDYFEQDGYFHLRQAQYIQQDGYPHFNDELSYGGRFYTFLPFFHYLLAGAGMALGLETAAKILPAFLGALIAVVAYLIALEMTKNTKAALMSAFIAGFIPVFIEETANSIDPIILAVPLAFFVLYQFSKINNGEKHIILYLVSFVTLVLSHPSSILVIIAIYCYILLCKVEKLKLSRIEFEVPIFSIFFWLWANLMIYKKAFLLHGLSAIWANLPPEIFRQSFTDIDLITALLKIGLVPFLTGLIIIYKGFFGEKRKSTFLYISFTISTGIMIWLKLISLALGFIYLGVVLAVLFSQFFSSMEEYLQKTRIASFRPYIIVGIAALFSITSVIPAFVSSLARDNHPNPNFIEGLAWIKENTPPGAVVMTLPEEGHALSYLTGRINFMDTNYLLVNDLEERQGILKNVYAGRFLVKALSGLNEHSVDYIVMSPLASNRYSTNKIAYEDNECIILKHSEKGTNIYSSECTLTKQE